MVRAEKLDPNNPLTHLNLGHVYRVQERIQDARTELETAVRLRPALSSAVYQLAMVYRQLGEQEKARKALDRFQKLNSEEKEQEEDPIDAAVSH